LPTPPEEYSSGELHAFIHRRLGGIAIHRASSACSIIDRIQPGYDKLIVDLHPESDKAGRRYLPHPQGPVRGQEERQKRISRDRGTRGS